jgi:hypothetical protein
LSPEAQACHDRLQELSAIPDDMSSLTPEKITSIQKEVGDCVYAESAGLSKEDLLIAYKLRDNTGKEFLKGFRNAAQKTLTEDNELRTEDNKLREAARKLGQGFLDQDKAYKDLIERYNTLVESHNDMVRAYRATVDQNGLFLDRMQQLVRAENYSCQVNALQSLINSAAQARPRIVYQPPAQLHCTTQNIAAPVAGLPSWSYTNCY